MEGHFVTNVVRHNWDNEIGEKMSENKKMIMESANCRYCGQVLAFQIPEDADLTKEELIEQATLKCSCTAADKYRDRLFQIDSGKAAIKKIVGIKNADLEEIFMNTLEKVVNGDVKKLTIQVDDQTTISMWLDKCRVKVQKKKLEIATSDGVITEE